jgi:hypothetical protein
LLLETTVPGRRKLFLQAGSGQASEKAKGLAALFLHTRSI